jgi:hypothetical protein
VILAEVSAIWSHWVRSRARVGVPVASAGDMTNFFVYMLGVILVVAALTYGANLMGISATWIAVFAVAVLGLGMMGAVVKTRQKEPS